MDCPNHGSTHRSTQGMSRMVMWSYCQCEATLSDNDFAICDFYRFDPQIGGKAVFFSPADAQWLPIQIQDAEV